MFDDDDARWLTRAEACEYLGVTPRTLYAWRKRGDLSSYRLGGQRLLFRADDLVGLVRRAE